MSGKCPLVASVLARASIKLGSGALQARVNSHTTEGPTFVPCWRRCLRGLVSSSAQGHCRRESTRTPRRVLLLSLGGVRACAGKYQVRLRGTAGASQLARHGGCEFCPLVASVLARASIKLGSGALQARVNSHATEDATFVPSVVDRWQRA